tara:strand:- start:24 stop:623 length:600 start_codon:yes stop_codon:yes gene_type:complete
MALLGQASGGFTESSSALRILHVGVRNTVGQLSANAFTQTNPPVIATGTTEASGLLDGLVRGVLSGSVAFAQNTGSNEHGGPANGVAVLGVFINNAAGNAFENQPGIASSRGPYVSAQGTYGNKLYETKGDLANGGTDFTYSVGDSLIASANGYLTSFNNATVVDADVFGGAKATATVIGILKIVPDSNSDELVYDQRI